MWNPVKISFKNLFSHIDTTYCFDNGRCTVVVGENRTDKSLENNGSGKSTLFEAVCIALTNDTSRNIKKEAFINRDAETCTVDFELYNSVLKKTLRIVRVFSRGNKPVAVKLYENGDLNTQITSVAEANKRIYELLGICREDLLRYYIVSQDSRYNFFTASDTEKKEIMNRITSADMINPLLDEVSRSYSEKKNAVLELEGVVERNNAKIEALQEQRENILNNDDSKERIKELSDEIKMLESDIVKCDVTVAETEKSLADVLKKISLVKIPDVAELNVKRKELKKEISGVIDKMSEAKSMIHKLEMAMDSEVECPSCGEKFIADSDLKMTHTEAEELISELGEKITLMTEEKKGFDKAVSKIDEKLTQYEEAVDKKRRLKIKQTEFEDTIEEKKKKAENKKKRINNIKQEIQQYKNGVKKNSVIEDIDNSISKINKQTRDITENQLNVLREECEMYGFWQFTLGKSGFATYLANKSIKIIEGTTNGILRKFGVEMSVLINGFKVLKNGDVREKIDVFVTSDGMNMDSFMSKSGGERGRVILAGIIGINHLINSSISGGGLNLLMLDESLSGIDCQGTMGIIDTIDKMGMTVLMITQNIEDAGICNNTVRIVKENGVSKIIQ